MTAGCPEPSTIWWYTVIHRQGRHQIDLGSGCYLLGAIAHRFSSSPAKDAACDRLVTMFCTTRRYETSPAWMPTSHGIFRFGFSASYAEIHAWRSDASGNGAKSFIQAWADVFCASHILQMIDACT
uniref:Uncharacterized protein n=1 Tax=Oryza meridionalis TaxID=40149 RepID=A0A0E0F017_9ORYZ